MNEFVYVEFIFDQISWVDGCEQIIALGEDFSLLDKGKQLDGYYHVTGRIASQMATVITLGNKFLSDRMHISYIDAELKHEYRNR
jgi:hypothetical protein